MKVAIHQPEHMPWLGFFHKINMADTYIVLDNVQYRRRYFQNRNKVRTKDGWQWLIVPLEKEKRDNLLIKDARIFQNDSEWKLKNLQRIYHNYSRARHFMYLWEGLKSVYEKDYEFLKELNLDLIRLFFEKLKINVNIKLASDLKVTSKKGDLIFDICKAVGARTYISGISGKDYLDLGKFKDNGIEVVMQEFHHPIYRQVYEPFIPCMSVIDLLFNHGENSLGIINGKRVPVVDTIYE